jgi:outer membrane lipoprotein-sorting protein
MRFIHRLFLCAVLAIGVSVSSGAESNSTMTASELASRLNALRQDGSSYVRLRMEIKGATPQTLQIQIKQRATKGASDLVYQILFPAERKGEAVLLKKTDGHAASGSSFKPPQTVRQISDLKEPLFGSDLSYEDVIDNPYGWAQQSIVGTETEQGVPCQILESKPGKADHSSYGSVKSWIDTRRMVPLRIEKYSDSGHVIRRIDASRIVADTGHHIPADLVVHGPRQDSSTALDGSRIRHDVNYTDADFSVDGLKNVGIPRGAPE